MAGTAIQRFLDSLGTYDHQQGMRLFDAAVKDAGTARSALLGILLNAANQHDENPVTPHAVPTAFSGLEAFSRAGWPASLPVIRFLALYSFTLRKRDWSPAALERLAGSVRVVPGAKLADALARAMGGGKPQEAAAVAVVLAKREGVMCIPPAHAELVCKTGELVQLRDMFGFQRIKEGVYTPGQIDQRWSDPMEKDFSKWLTDHIDKLPVPREQIQELLKQRTW